MSITKIPKIIHYCWFGGNTKPQMVNECIESWKKYCPDYQIMEWNENNFDVWESKFTADAYHEKKWAFVADYARLAVLYEYGGVYLDTDLEILKNIDIFLEDQAFLGFETKDTIATGVIGCEKKDKLIGQLLQYYDTHPFSEKGNMVIPAGPTLISGILRDYGIKLTGKKEVVRGWTLYPERVFYPYGVHELFKYHSKQSFTYHHYMSSWKDNGSTKQANFPRRLRLFMVRIARNTLGTNRMRRIGIFAKRFLKRG